MLHALPLTYNKDLQEDKEHLFDAVDTLGWPRGGCRDGPRRARFAASGWRQAASDELIAATDLADLLVRRGMPFREAHGVVAGLVRDAPSTAAARWPSYTARSSPRTPSTCDAEVYEVLAATSWLESKVSEGGTALGARARAARRGAGAARRARLSGRSRALTSTPARCRGRARAGRLRRRHGDTAGVIVETEAYHEASPPPRLRRARRRAPRSCSAPPGRAYVYRSYGSTRC